MQKLCSALVLIAALTAPALAQKTEAKKPREHPATAPAKLPDPAVPLVPGATHEEQLEMENLQLRMALLQEYGI